MEQIVLGIIGAGPIVEKKHLPALAEVREIEVVAACRRDGQALGQLADRFRIQDRYTDYRDVLRDDRINAVLIAAGPPAHVPMVIDAAAAGKHIFVEKPVAESSADAALMCRAAKEANVFLQVGYNKRFYYGYQQARRVLDEGRLGPLSGIGARFWYQSGRRDPLLHNGIHFLDLLQFFGGSVTSVYARRFAATSSSGGGDTLSIALTFENGAVGSLLLSSLAAWDYPNERVDIVGSNGSALTIENGRQARMFRRGEGAATELHESTLSVHWWSGHEEQGFASQLRFFARRIMGGARADDANPAAGPREAIASLALVEAIRDSIERADHVTIARAVESTALATAEAALRA
jgi:predicted dehydrogenase